MRWLACAEAEVPGGVEWLSVREQRRLEALRFPKRRTEFLLRRWTGKRVAATALGLPVSAAADLARVELLNHLTGAPYVEVDGARAEVDVSLTDRAGHAVGLVGPVGTGPGTLGVDLELVEPRTEGFVTDFLTAAEAEWVRARRTAHGEDGWQAAANLLWSAKEAALKVLRVGLRADTRTVAVTVGELVRADGWAPLTVRADHGPVFPGWWRREGRFVLTVAYAAPREPPALLTGGVELAVAEPVHSWMDDPGPVPPTRGHGPLSSPR
jgi:4'-phosphopantetheinyl transferase